MGGKAQRREAPLAGDPFGLLQEGGGDPGPGGGGMNGEVFDLEMIRPDAQDDDACDIGPGLGDEDGCFRNRLGYAFFDRGHRRPLQGGCGMRSFEGSGSLSGSLSPIYLACNRA